MFGRQPASSLREYNKCKKRQLRMCWSQHSAASLLAPEQPRHHSYSLIEYSLTGRDINVCVVTHESGYDVHPDVLLRCQI